MIVKCNNINVIKVTKMIYVVGVCGGTASGKSLTSRRILETVNGGKSVIISQDRFYHNSHEGADFDVPEAIDFDLMGELVSEFVSGKEVELPNYDFKTHKRTDETTKLSPEGIKLLIIEGILIFAVKKIRDLCDFKVFIQADPDIRLGRRMIRDINERGRDPASVFRQWEDTVKPAHDNIVEPSSAYADMIIPNTKKNKFNGIDHLCKFIKLKVEEAQD